MDRETTPNRRPAEATVDSFVTPKRQGIVTRRAEETPVHPTQQRKLKKITKKIRKRLDLKSPPKLVSVVGNVNGNNGGSDDNPKSANTDANANAGANENAPSSPEVEDADRLASPVSP